MYICEHMTSPVITVTSDTLIHEAWSIMQDNDIRRLPVVDNGKLVGLVTQDRLRDAEPPTSSGLSMWDVHQIIIASAFGTYIDVSSAVTIGMLPRLPLYRYRQIGNAAGGGARLAVASRDRRAEARTISNLVRYVESTTAPNFRQTFLRMTRLG